MCSRYSCIWEVCGIESICSELSNATEYNWIDKIMVPKLEQPLDANSRDQLKSHLSKIIIAEQNLQQSATHMVG